MENGSNESFSIDIAFQGGQRQFAMFSTYDEARETYDYYQGLSNVQAAYLYKHYTFNEEQFSSLILALDRGPSIQ